MDSEFIRHVRRRVGLTQADLAEALDVDQGTVSRWERGQTTPRPANISAMRTMLLRDDENRVRDRTLALVRCNIIPATLMDKNLRLTEGSRLAEQHFRARSGRGLSQIVGTSFEEYADRGGGMNNVFRNFENSGFMDGEVLIFRFAMNHYGKGHVTVYEPILDEGNVVGVMQYVSAYFELPANDEVSVELVQCVLAGDPTRLFELYQGSRAEIVKKAIG